MATNSITNGTDLNTTNGIKNNNLNNTTQKSNDELGKDEFLKLLIAQMQNQDPLDPQDNGEYIAQLAQFSALEQMTNVADAMTLLGGLVNNLNTSVLVGQVNNFIGKDVKWEATDKNGDVTTHKGKVTGVKIVDGVPYAIVKELKSDGTEGDAFAIAIGDLTGIGNLEDVENADTNDSN